ncbi:hypothetical protein DFH07DRAFT_785007 [Mycena maculata]|uniref:Uncharacterized protein n=1 Tax=Mycena maculata TaxID=230809 RepID=A0AAD7MIQ8_9AGAR|nr:hypothetical protein DFH07DRAFT_785007 [Mycena maculata]
MASRQPRGGGGLSADLWRESTKGCRLRRSAKCQEAGRCSWYWQTYPAGPREPARAFKFHNPGDEADRRWRSSVPDTRVIWQNIASPEYRLPADEIIGASDNKIQIRGGFISGSRKNTAHFGKQVETGNPGRILKTRDRVTEMSRWSALTVPEETLLGDVRDVRIDHRATDHALRNLGESSRLTNHRVSAKDIREEPRLSNEGEAQIEYKVGRAGLAGQGAGEEPARGFGLFGPGQSSAELDWSPRATNMKFMFEFDAYQNVLWPSGLLADLESRERGSRVAPVD